MLPSESMHSLLIHPSIFHLLRQGSAGSRLHNKCFRRLPDSISRTGIPSESLPRESRSGRNYEHHWLTVPAKLSILTFVQASTQTYTMGQAQFRYFTTLLKRQLDKTVESNGGPTRS